VVTHRYYGGYRVDNIDRRHYEAVRDSQLPNGSLDVERTGDIVVVVVCAALLAILLLAPSIGLGWL